MDLAFDDHGVYDRPTIVHDHVFLDFDHSGVRVYGNTASMCCIGEGCTSWLVAERFHQAGITTLRKSKPLPRSPGDIGNSHTDVGAGHCGPTSNQLNICRVGFEHLGGDPPDALSQTLGSDNRCPATNSDRPRGGCPIG